jgi:transposase, IS30 family
VRRSPSGWQKAGCERGIKESTNGLMRQYLTKGSGLRGYTQAQLDDIAFKLNVRPRKSLGWKRLAELLLPESAFDYRVYWAAKLAPVAVRA